MRFTVLGSGTSAPDAARGPAGFLVEAGGAKVLVDGGGGTMRTLARAGVDARTLDGGVYSHRHLDHCGELLPLLFAMKASGLRDRDYPIWAGEGFAAYLAALEALHPGWLRGSAWGPEVQELPLIGPGEAELPGGVRLRTLPANHSAGALHLSFEGPGGRVVFSGDTGPSENLVTLALGADLLVCECAFAAPNPRGGHLWPEAVAEIVDAARPAEVALTHFYDEVEPRRALEVVAATGVPVCHAADLQTFSF